MLALAGLGAGALHVVSGPDHLAALGPVASRRPTRAARLGALWGVGHGAGVLVAAALAHLVGSAVDLAPLAQGTELLVGVALILLGARALRSAPVAKRDAERTLVGVGALHGVAGTHHLLGVLPAVAMSRADAAGYLAGYLVAAVVAMSLVGMVLRLSTRGRSPEFLRRVRQGSGVLAIAVGIGWAALAVL